MSAVSQLTGDLDVIADEAGLRLRRKRHADALDDYAWKRDPELARFDARRPLTAGFSAYLADFERELLFADPSRCEFALEADDRLHIGNVMYYHGDHVAGSAELGLTIGRPDFRGRGLGRRATTLFLRYAWTNLPFRLIYLHTLEWNERARACFRAAGFEEVARVLRGEDVFVRMEVRREWWLMWEMEGRFRPERGEGPSPTGPAPRLSP